VSGRRLGGALLPRSTEKMDLRVWEREQTIPREARVGRGVWHRKCENTPCPWGGTSKEWVAEGGSFFGRRNLRGKGDQYLSNKLRRKEYSNFLNDQIWGGEVPIRDRQRTTFILRSFHLEVGESSRTTPEQEIKDLKRRLGFVADS